VVIRRRHSNEALGISIAGGFGSALGDVPIFIAAIDENGPANEKLRIGERIVSINGQSSERITHNECAQMLRSSPQNVNLEVRFYYSPYAGIFFRTFY
jgi:C-terminal processing protease CtpA/Prc